MDDEVRACASCGSAPQGDDEHALARATWARSVERGRIVWTCPTCQRTYARSIEGKLDAAWW